MEVLSEIALSGLGGFHELSTTDLLRRMQSDDEVDNLFCSNDALGLRWPATWPDGTLFPW